jgi:hypothetical protein
LRHEPACPREIVREQAIVFDQGDGIVNIFASAPSREAPRPLRRCAPRCRPLQ